MRGPRNRKNFRRNIAQRCSGQLIDQIAKVAYDAFREPPWSDDMEMPRLHLGLGVDLMRTGAIGYLARQRISYQVAGYVIGYEVFARASDTRDLTLTQIAGKPLHDYLCDTSSRLFYIDTICVAKPFRRLGAAHRLLLVVIDEATRQGFTQIISRTALAHQPMRALFTKLGFTELAVHDAVFPDRSFWHLHIDSPVGV